MNKVILFFSVVTSLHMICPCAYSEQPDTWEVTGAPNAVAEDRVERWCEINGAKVRYANFPIPGYEPCGNLSAQATCDPSGNRFFGAGPSPYQYLDCTRGQRIQIISGVKLPEGSFSGMIGRDGTDKTTSTWTERKRKELEALLNDPATPEKEKSAARGSANLGAELSLNHPAFVQVLKAAQERNQQLKDLLKEP